MRTNGVTTTATTITTVASIGARPTSWCNKWNSTLLGQQQRQQWPKTTIRDDKRSPKLGTRETKKMAPTSYKQVRGGLPVKIDEEEESAVTIEEAFYKTPSASLKEANWEQEAPLLIDLNPFIDDPLRLVNCILTDQQHRQNQESKKEKCHQFEDDHNNCNKKFPSSTNFCHAIGSNKCPSTHNHNHQLYQKKGHQAHRLQQLQFVDRKSATEEVKECDFRKDMMANDEDCVAFCGMEELHDFLVRGNHGVDCEKISNHNHLINSIEENKLIKGKKSSTNHHHNLNQAKSSSSSEAQVFCNVDEGETTTCESFKCTNHHQPDRKPHNCVSDDTNLDEFHITLRRSTKHRKRIARSIRYQLSNLIETTGSSFFDYHHSGKLESYLEPAIAASTECCHHFQMKSWLRIAEIVVSFIIYILIFTSMFSAPVSATNYWPLTRNAHKQQQPLQTATVSSQEPKLASHQLLIGQHYNNFSSIVPYSIVQDSDYGSMQDELVDQLEKQEQEQQEQNANQQQPQQQQLVGQQYYQQQHQLQLPQQLQHEPENHALRSAMAFDDDSDSTIRSDTISTSRDEGNLVNSKSRALLQALSLDSNRLMLPQMQQIKSRFNQGCVGGTKCQFFAFCWMSGGSLGASCGLLMTCCVTPSRQEIQPGFYGPVVNDPYCGRSTSKINRIVGGTDASFGQFPWQAFVQVGGSRCGGALISSRHVVTAGHCVARSQHSPSSIKVTLGDYILNSDIESIPHEVFSVVEVLLHPNFRFTPQADRYDVAVLELDRTASYKDNIKPICLPQKDATFVGRVAYVAGWGALQAGSKLRPKVLQHVAVPVIENHVCESWHRRKGIDIRIYDEMMCAGYELGQRDACQGDSGGPLMLNQYGVWYLVGIVSAGYSCAKQYQPGIYHRVSSSSDWISSNIYQQGANK